jgi:hypothetical protein
MKKTMIAFFMMILLTSSASAAEEIPLLTSDQIINQAKEMDGKSIQYEGEIIGDVLSRGEFAWLSITDGANALAVYLPTSEIPEDLVIGRYATRGDLVTITGDFHRACAEHGGDMDIHGETLVLIKSGFSVPVQTSTKFSVLTGSVFLCALTGLFYIKKLHAKIL